MLSATGTREGSMSKASLDNRHRNKDGEISGKHGNTLIRTLRKVYGQGFAAGYPDTEKLSEVLLKLNETSLSQLRRDHETGHLGHKIAGASK
jgi:phage gp45-like